MKLHIAAYETKNERQKNKSKRRLYNNNIINIIVFFLVLKTIPSISTQGIRAMKTHYDTLNVSSNASKAEIKQAFHKLSLKYHPDLTKSKSTTNSELFKQISSAYSVLSDDVQRQKYDLELDDWKRFGQHRRRPHPGSGGFATGDDFGSQRAGSRTSYSSFHRILDVIYKPRNLVFGVTLGLFAASAIKSMLGIKWNVQHAEKKKLVGDGKKKLVEAWMNPKTGQWEQPAPWSKTFQQLNPEIHLVPRENVKPSRQ